MARTTSPWPMISIEEATNTALSFVSPLPPQKLPLGQLQGRVLAEDLVSRETLPAVPTSIVDGYAVDSSDGPGEYPVIATPSRAGGAAASPMTKGSVCYVTTGGPVPEGADAMVMVEDTEKLPDGRVRINKAAGPRAMIREIGSDIEVGEKVLSAGDVVGPAEIGLLATVGAVSALVSPQPTVAVLSTGDELAEPDDQGPLRPGVVRDSNRAMLIAACAAEGARAIDLGIAKDTAEALEGRFDEAISKGADILVTSGGVSMGDRDLVKPLLEKRGVIHYGRVLMKPGKPLTFATVETPERQGKPRLLVFGLPGNPVSSIVTFHLVVHPCIRKLKGFADPYLRRVRALTSTPLKLDPERPEYHRVMLKWDDASGSLVGVTTGGQRSSRLLSMRSANALLELPQASGVLPAGSVVSALVIGDLSLADLRSKITMPFLPAAPPAPAACPITYSGAAAKPKIGVLTVSDRASTGIYEDLSGPMIVEVLREFLLTECDIVTRCVPDTVPLIAGAIRSFASSGCCLVCTTGGTGPSVRDVTPEAMAEVCDKMYDGFGEQMRRVSLDQGKPGSVRTCLDAVFPAVPYCIDLLGGPFLEGREERVKVFRPPQKK